MHVIERMAVPNKMSAKSRDSQGKYVNMKVHKDEHLTKDISRISNSMFLSLPGSTDVNTQGLSINGLIL